MNTPDLIEGDGEEIMDQEGTPKEEEEEDENSVPSNQNNQEDIEMQLVVKQNTKQNN